MTWWEDNNRFIRSVLATATTTLLWLIVLANTHQTASADQVSYAAHATRSCPGQENQLTFKKYGYSDFSEYKGPNGKLVVILVDRTDAWAEHQANLFKGLVNKILFSANPVLEPGDRLTIKAIHGAATANRVLFDAYLPPLLCQTEAFSANFFKALWDILFSDCKPSEADRLQRAFAKDIALLARDLLEQPSCSNYSEITESLIELGNTITDIRKRADYALISVYILSDMIENTPSGFDLLRADESAATRYMKNRGAEARLEGVKVEVEPVKYMHGGHNVELTTEQWRKIERAWRTFFAAAKVGEIY